MESAADGALRRARAVPSRTGSASSSSAVRATTEATASRRRGCSRSAGSSRPSSRLGDPGRLPRRPGAQPRPGARLRPRSGGARTPAAGFEQLRRALSEADGVVDALFGTGLGRPLRGVARRAVDAINRSGRPVVAADVPSGLSADGGSVAGAAVRAAVTVAFGAPKLCHVLAPASGLCGRLVVADIGIPRATLEKSARRVWLAEASDVRSAPAAAAARVEQGGFRPARDRRRLARKGRRGDPRGARSAARGSGPGDGLLRRGRSRTSWSARCPRP